ncbi:MAG: methyltransferase domain-containing protein [Ignavibacteriaceae bacterium]
MKLSVLLPGMDDQFLWFSNLYDVTGKTILVVGESSDGLAKFIEENFQAKVFFIVHEEDALFRSRLTLSANKNISVRLMDFSQTDFKDNFFDVVYAQASVTVKERKKIAKEFFRITKPGGVFCVGEMCNLKKEVPQVIADVWNRSSLAPLFVDELVPFYESAQWKFVEAKDLSETLDRFYIEFEKKAARNLPNLPEGEKKLHKKFIHKISHHANVFLRHGGYKNIGFSAMLFEKEIK